MYNLFAHTESFNKRDWIDPSALLRTSIEEPTGTFQLIIDYFLCELCALGGRFTPFFVQLY